MVFGITPTARTMNRDMPQECDSKAGVFGTYFEAYIYISQLQDGPEYQYCRADFEDILELSK